jgi:phosphoglycerol transferase MdoB-like AlkP superfamily enzyme
VSRWERFYKLIQQDLKLFLFFVLLFSLFRAGFIVILHKYIDPATTMKDIFVTLFYGLRISLKSAGVIAILSFIFSTVLSVLFKNEKLNRIRLGLGYLYVVLLSFLFHARIPYYETFHTSFNQFIFNTFKDDTSALLSTMIKEYHLLLKLLSVFIIAGILCKLLRKYLALPTFSAPVFQKNVFSLIFKGTVIIVMAVFILFVRFGGSLTYAKSIHWENVTVTKDAFLNEAVLDEMQSLYRAYSIHENLKKAAAMDITPAKLKEFGNRLAQKDVVSNNIDDFLQKQAGGAKIPKPKHIFLIIGESYAQWPLLPKYQGMNIANGMKGIVAKENAVLVQPFLPTGPGTSNGVNGIISGMPEVNLYLNYQPETYKEVYATSIAAQMKKLGYQTNFWYNGFYSWQRIKDFTLAQGFDTFHSCSDFIYPAGNAWGSEDRYFYDAFKSLFKGDEPSFNVLLTSSNHPPFTVHIKEEGFNDEIIDPGLRQKLKTDDELLLKLGHFWYADKMMADFIESMRRVDPDSLFIVTGDHADRVNIEANPDFFERYAIPLIFYGPGIHKGMFGDHAAGSHINITPTLIELIAPEGFTYYSVGRSLTNNSQFGFNHILWITPNHIGMLETNKRENFSGVTTSTPNPEMDESEMKKDIEAMRALTWWRIQHGKYIQ